MTKVEHYNMTCHTVFALVASIAVLTTVVSATDNVDFAVRTKQRSNSQDFQTPLDLNSVNPQLPFKFIVHGWIDWGNNTWIQNLSYAFLEKGDYNVIAVNWHNLAQKAYVAAARETRQVGKAIANEVVRLSKNKNVPLSNFHLIGHSLGAHIVGIAGKEVLRATGKKVGWITGLDPAGPLFEVPRQPKANRLSNEDARWVEIIHSDGGILGFISPLGDSDFYPNGGTFIQPGCNLTLENVKDAIGCSHMLSTSFYTDAVRQGGVEATKCVTWEMFQAGQCRMNQKAKYGAEKPPNVKGIFFNVV